MYLPLKDLLVIDFSQFLAGPSATLRLADLGATVIKIERPTVNGVGGGDAGRHLSIGNLSIGGESALFQTINRNKQSYVADLKDPTQKQQVIELIKKADVLVQNFRPSVMKKIGLDYDSVKDLNPKLVYASVSGYGTSGVWADKPGQDLLIQAISGVCHLNGNADQPPQPFGLSIADMVAGAHLVQGILALLVRRGITNRGGVVDISLMESMLDLQFEVLTTHLNDGNKLPQRSTINNANAYLGAPYGIYTTQDGHIALAMGSVVTLGELLDCEALTVYKNPDDWFDKRDTIKQILQDHLITQTTAHWLSLLEPADYWCADVLDWHRLLAHDGFKTLGMVQDITTPDTGKTVMQTTRCPIRVDGHRLYHPTPAPKLGQDTHAINETLLQNSTKEDT